MIELKNMKREVIGLFLLIFIFLLGCKKYTLKDEINEYQPYRVGDIMIFESTKGEVDSIFIKKIEKSYTSDDNLSILPDKHQNMVVAGEISLQKSFKTKIGHVFSREHIDLISLYADENIYFNFEFSKKSDGLSYPTTALLFTELEEMLNSKKKFLYESIDIEVIDQYNPSFEYDLEKIYWSKKIGYVKFQFKNDYEWVIKKFLRNGNDILKTKI